MLFGCRAGAIWMRGRQRGIRLALVVSAKLIGFLFVDGTGMGDLFGDAELVELVDDLARLDFQLPRQLIDSNLTHIEAFRLLPATTPIRHSSRFVLG